MTHFRLRWEKVGGHVHVSVWSGTSRETTHARNGTLIFRENEWNNLRELIDNADITLEQPDVIEIVSQNESLP